MVMGYEITGDARYLDVAVRGTDFLLGNFRDSLNGGFFARVDASGPVINAAKNTYGHAFALLALSHMPRLTKEEKYRIAALNAWRDIDLHLSESHGGFRSEAPRDFGHRMNRAPRTP
jgi:mannobiose 2-epimerase